MPEEKTRADSFRLYLSGAGSDSGAQTDPNASLGGFRSSTLATFLTAQISNPIGNITADHISGPNGEGSGSINAPGIDSLTWTPPGGIAGPAVTILNGETKILEGGGAPQKFVRVTRTSATDLTGTATYTLAKAVNGLIGFDNTSSAEAVAGDVEHRGGIGRNESASEIKGTVVYINTLGTQQVSGSTQLGASGAGSITLAVGNFNDWPNSGFCRVEDSGGALQEIVYYSSRTSTTLVIPSAGRAQLGTSAQAGTATDKVYAVPGIRIAIEAPVADAIQVIANESTAPIGVTWGTPITQAAGLLIGDLAASAKYGIWIEQTVVEASISEGVVEKSLKWYFEAT